jgi:hypothetical protein
MSPSVSPLGRARFVRAVATVASASFLVASPVLGAAPRVYEVHPIGLTDAEHTGGNGWRMNEIYGYNAAGQAIGTSERLVEFGDYGRSAWFYDPIARRTTLIGLRGAGYSGPSDWVDVYPMLLNSGGQVVGNSSAWDGATWQGWHAWYYDHATNTTSRIGLTDAEHTAANGEQQSHPDLLNAAGTVVGTSRRYNGTADAGMTAWMRNGASGLTVPIGPANDPVYTRADGYRYSTPVWLDPTGFVIGATNRYNGSADAGRVAWLYEPATGGTTRLGFTGAPYVGPNGTENTLINGVRRSRWVIGYSSTFAGLDEYFDPWVYDIQGRSYRHYGLTDADHTKAGSFRSSFIAGMNDRGDVAGSSTRFPATGSVIGSTAWFYEASTGQYQTIGLSDAEHSGTTGLPLNQARFISAAGHVAGTAVRKRTGTWPTGGTSAWLFDPATDTTTRLGLYDAAHSHPFGYQISDIIDMNDAGQVIGYSERYGDTPTNTAWFYDPVTKVQTSLIFSVFPNGYYGTDAAYLGEDGVVLGTYVKDTGTIGYSAFDDHAFFWSAKDGFHDLGTFVADGLDPQQWDHLARALGRAGPHIFGTGYEDQRYGLLAYVLSPKAGDANYDGQVDFADLVVLAQNYNSADRSYEQGDFTGDGRVDFADLVLLAQNYNSSPAAGQLAELSPAFRADLERAQAEVPEPVTACVLAGWGLVLNRRRRR